MPVVKLDVFAVIFDQRFGRSRVENGKMNDKWSRVRQSYTIVEMAKCMNAFVYCAEVNLCSIN